MVNSIPDGVPFYPTDHASVLRINNDNINYRYLAYKLEQAGIQEGFSRTYRASLGQIKELIFTLRDIQIQDEAVEQEMKLEKMIQVERNKIDDINFEKEKVLEEFLR